MRKRAPNHKPQPPKRKAGTKEAARTVRDKLKQASEAEARIDATCSDYRPVAARGTVI